MRQELFNDLFGGLYTLNVDMAPHSGTMATPLIQLISMYSPIMLNLSVINENENK